MVSSFNLMKAEEPKEVAEPLERRLYNERQDMATLHSFLIKKERTYNGKARCICLILETYFFSHIDKKHCQVFFSHKIENGQQKKMQKSLLKIAW